MQRRPVAIMDPVARDASPLQRPSSIVRRDAATRLAATVLFLGSAAVVVGWWTEGGGVRDLAGWATGLTSVGRVSGLLASFLLLVQVLLMARIPVLEAAFGQDSLTRMHRVVGFTSFSLLVVHIAAITWGYAAGQVSAFASTLWNLTVTYPGMLLAAGGSVALTMVVVTSLRLARGRLRYESWHLLHLYAYLGVGLALPHQLWTGQEFTSSRTSSLLWWSAWIATAAAVIAFRIGAPIRVNLRHRLRVVSVTHEGGRTWSVLLEGRRLDRLSVEAGQFFDWRFLSRPGWSRANPYSLSAAPDGDHLRITVQAAGDGSSAVRHLQPGTRALVEGPFGRLSRRPRTKSRVTFIGAGVGITPLRALAEGLDYAPGDAVYIERYSDEPLFSAETDRLAVQRGLRVLRVGGSRRSPGSWLGASAGPGDDLGTLRAWVPDITEHDVYVCGPTAWSELVLDTLRAAGVPGSQVHVETFER